MTQIQSKGASADVSVPFDVQAYTCIGIHLYIPPTATRCASSVGGVTGGAVVLTLPVPGRCKVGSEKGILGTFVGSARVPPSDPRSHRVDRKSSICLTAIAVLFTAPSEVALPQVRNLRRLKFEIENL